MIKVKYAALVEIEMEVSEHRPGIMPFEKIVERFDGGKFMDDGLRRCIEHGFVNDENWTLRVTRQNAELWMEE